MEMKIFCIVLLVWFCLEDATRCFKEEHMATGPTLHVVIVTNLITAPPGHAAGTARPAPMPCHPYLRRHQATPRCLSLACSLSLSLPLPCRAPTAATSCAVVTGQARPLPPSPLHPSLCPANGTTASALPFSRRGTPQLKREPPAVL
jgi:hypothetical protein